MGKKRADDQHFMPDGICCECGHGVNGAGGQAARPTPGDWAVCIRCAALNVFADDLSLRAPTGFERLDAAADPDVQRWRKAILAIKALN